MKILADAMLGRLAKWLRIMGHDTAYRPHLDDWELVRLARAEARLLLTRDRDLVERKGLKAVLVRGDRLEEQLEQLLRELDLDIEGLPPRCVRCNTVLEVIERDEAEGRVPSYVFHRHREFTLCPRCDRVYWRGSHWKRIQERIDEIRGNCLRPL
jgi:uncharacterized protein with PIN domain